MEEAIPHLICVALAVWPAGWLVSRIVARAGEGALSSCDGDEKQALSGVTSDLAGAGRSIGRLERAFFYGAFALPHSTTVVAAWLAFKLAAKWDARRAYVPDRSELTQRQAKIAASYDFSRFVAGTLANLVAGGGGFLLATALQEL